MENPARSPRDGRWPRHADELRGAEALPPAARPARWSTGSSRRAARAAPTRSSSSPRRPRATSSPAAASTVAVQETPLGTGDAVRSRAQALAAHDGDVLVLSGDTPLLTAGLLRELVETHRRDRRGRDRSSAPSRPTPRLYGRVVRAADGTVLRSSREPTRPRRSSGSARSTPRSTSSAPTRSGRRSSSCSRRTCRASST